VPDSVIALGAGEPFSAVAGTVYSTPEIEMTSCVPSGDQSGDSSDALPAVTWIGVPPDDDTRNTSRGFTLSRATYAIVVPSGDHAGVYMNPFTTPATRRDSAPVAIVRTHSSSQTALGLHGDVTFSRMNASFDPSGDHAG
jgi:hypothetical protein